MMRALPSICCAVSLAACAPAEASPPKRFILAGDAREHVLHQCSRPAPQGTSSFWVPSAKDLDDLESKLAPELVGYHDFKLDRPDLLETYHRQYVGIVIEGRQLIYGNFYPIEDFPKMHEQAETNEAYMVCDGGPFFFGVTYDETERKILGVDFNGAPGLPLPPPKPRD